MIWIAHFFVLEPTSAWIGLNGVMVSEIALADRTNCSVARLVDICGWPMKIFKSLASCRTYQGVNLPSPGAESIKLSYDVRSLRVRKATRHVVAVDRK